MGFVGQFFTRKFFRNPFSSELDPPTSYLCLITGTWGDFSNLQPYVVQYAIVCNEDRQDALILDHKIWGGFIASAIQILAVHQQMVQFESKIATFLTFKWGFNTNLYYYYTYNSLYFTSMPAFT